MPNDTLPNVRNSAALDPRVARTTRALGAALIELVQERDFGEITVRDILDRAGVGRTAFYAHYRNKEDVLYSSYERLFVALESLLDRPSARADRLFPVAELLDHLAESRGIVDGLRRSGQLDEMWALCAEHAARIIDRRLASGGHVSPAIPRPLLARMLAGALMEAIGWWLDRPKAATPAEMDAAFHGLARGACAGVASPALIAARLD